MIESQERKTDLKQWQLDGSSAEAYERYLVPLFFDPGADALIELAGLEPSERVLDVACGTGIVTRRAARGNRRTRRRTGPERGHA